VALFLNDDQVMLQHTARSFLAERAPVAHLRALRDAADPTGFSRDLWAQFAGMGFNGILIGESYGGLGLGHVEAGVVLEAIGRNLSPSPFLATALGAATALAEADAELRARWLPAIVAGDAVAGIAVDETPRHRPELIALHGKRAGDGFQLNGVKVFVPHGHVADLLIVAARTAGSEADEQGVTLFAVPGGTAGLAATAIRLTDAGLVAEIRFDHVLVEARTVIGKVDSGRAVLSRLLDTLRVGAAMELLGVGCGAMDCAIAHIKERRQFGVAIGSFQALQHRAAHLYAELEVARAAVLKAQQSLDAGHGEATQAVSVAKAMTDLAATLAVQEGVQLHGGVGVTDELDIGFFMKRAKVLAALYGGADYQADRLARLAGY
jgi:alkylation response protein AidB-like acyl-CoA dehydrogenase